MCISETTVTHHRRLVFPRFRFSSRVTEKPRVRLPPPPAPSSSPRPSRANPIECLESSFYTECTSPSESMRAAPPRFETSARRFSPEPDFSQPATMEKALSRLCLITTRNTEEHGEFQVSCAVLCSRLYIYIYILFPPAWIRFSSEWHRRCFISGTTAQHARQCPFGRGLELQKGKHFSSQIPGANTSFSINAI